MAELLIVYNRNKFTEKLRNKDALVASNIDNTTVPRIRRQAPVMIDHDDMNKKLKNLDIVKE